MQGSRIWGQSLTPAGSQAWTSKSKCSSSRPLLATRWYCPPSVGSNAKGLMQARVLSTAQVEFLQVSSVPPLSVASGFRNPLWGRSRRIVGKTGTESFSATGRNSRCKGGPLEAPGWQEDSPLESFQLKTSFLWTSLPWSPLHVHAKSLPSCLTVCDPVDWSPPSSSVPGILQAKILK